MSNNHWEIDHSDPQYDHVMKVKSPDGWMTASVRKDGCIDFVKYFNEIGGEDCDCYHICDIDEYIEKLIELKKLAMKHFGQFWPP